MNILIIMGGFFPGKKYGGPPVSVNNFCTLLEEFQCYIVTKNHDMGESAPYCNIKRGWNDRKNCKVLYLKESQYNISSFDRVFREIKPDVLYLQGMFQQCIFPCLKLAKKYKTKVLLAPRGELCEGAFKKKYKKLPYIYVLKLMKLLKGVHYQSTSEEESTAIKKYLDKNGKSIYFLPNIPSFSENKIEREEKKRECIKIVFLSRIVPKKNLIYAIKLLQEIKGAVQFDIYGPIEDERYWDECKSEIESLPSNIKVTYMGMTTHDKVHEVFSHYDVFLFPTLSENYGHVIVEAMLAECLIIISDQTPWTNLDTHGCGGSYSLNNPECFVEKLQEITLYDESEIKLRRKNIRNYISAKLNFLEIKEAYLKAFNQINDE